MEIQRLKAWLGGGLAVVILLGCGGMEVDDPVQSVESASKSERSASEDVETVQHGSERNGGQSTEEEAQPAEVVESEDCQKLCFQAQWCQEEGEDLEGCVEACEDGGFDGLMAASTMACFDEAISCTGMERCTMEIEVCDEFCQAAECGERCKRACGEAVLGGGEASEALRLCVEEDRGCEALGFCSEQGRRG